MIRIFPGPPLRYRLRRLWRRLHGLCVQCGGTRQSFVRGAPPLFPDAPNVHSFVARRDHLCYWCAKTQNHASNYAGVPGGRR